MLSPIPSYPNEKLNSSGCGAAEGAQYMKFKRILTGAAAMALVSVGVAQAAVITDGSGQYSVGIGANGELYDGGIGLRRNADGFDPIAPGTPRDSWGLNGAYADQSYFGAGGIVSTVVVANGVTATATTLTDEGFSVVQTYSFDGNILKIETAVTNTTGDILSAFFQRNVDWDMVPYSFENTTSGPYGPGKVFDSSFYGFEDPAGNGTYGSSCKAGCNETGDLGAGIRLKLGAFNAGATKHFTFYYGLSDRGQDTGGLVDQTLNTGAKYVLAGASTDGQGSATLGVAVPEPATWGMMIMGFFGLGSAVRRRRAAAV